MQQGAGWLSHLLELNLNLAYPSCSRAVEYKLKLESQVGDLPGNREFRQADVDVVGSKKMDSEIECLAATVAILKERA